MKIYNKKERQAAADGFEIQGIHMIKNKRELRAYLQVDRMMNRNVFSYGWKERLKNCIVRDYVMDFLVHLRKYEYYMNQRGPIARLLELHHHRVYRELGVKLGFSIPPNVFGCGLVLPHYGTVVIGGENTLGNFCVINTATCITEGRKTFGDDFFLATGAKVIGADMHFGSGVSVAANSVVRESFPQSNVLLGGLPAHVIKESQPWYIRDGEPFRSKVERCKALLRDAGML